MNGRLARTWRFARHTAPSQIRARLVLLAKRRLLERLPALSPIFDGRPPAAAAAMAPAPAPPEPVFAPRKSVHRAGEGLILDLLNRPFRIEPPVAWHDPALDTGTRLAKLKLHSMEYLEDVDDAAFTALVKDWILANPRYKRQYWLDSWNCYALSLRTVAWMAQIGARAGRLDEEFVAAVRLSLHDQLRFLKRNIEEDILGNHIVRNIKALIWGGRFFAGREADEWMRQGLRLLRREVPRQILADGFHYERSPAYHGQVFADLIEIYRLLEPSQREWLEPYLDAMAQVAADMAHGDGRCALFNDGGLEMTYAPAELAEAWRRLSGRPASVPRERFCFPEGGYFGARIGAACLIVDCGPMSVDRLMAHAHGDILSFELSWGGQRLIVDPGVFEYAAGERRRYSRATASHNTIALDGRDQAEFFGSFRVGRRGRGRLLALDPRGAFALRGTHDGYDHLAGSPRHERSFRFEGCRLVIGDQVAGGAGQTASGRLLLHPDCRVERVSDFEVAVRAPAILLRVISSAAPLTIGDAHYAPDFGQWLATRCIDFSFGAVPAANRLTLELG